MWPYPAGYGFPLPFSRAGIRFSILPSPAGDLGLPRGRLTARVFPADPIGVYTFRMRKVCGRGGCLLYAEIFGVHVGVDHRLRTECDRIHHRLNQGISMTLLSFDASTEIHSRSPVRPSPDPVCPPGSGIYPLGLLRRLRTGRYQSRTRRMATGSNTIPGSSFEPLPSCDLVSH